MLIGNHLDLKTEYSVGALLYTPAINENISRDIIEEKFGRRYSLALCLEDAILIIPGLFEPPVRTLRATIPENESHIFR